ncbi:NAD(P)H-dependent oxidoreductase [Hyphobacterium sp. HN65]|uniref:NAD(P)H-dependent oxidoreductase n=1 Tax=Hyphobacterium lacteum TaxID=3116575 RepID=A0ABU7LRD6_9PROT|nr:NAD(P)H-dependent oxidoreductase [Hyphobacterium sp. HN65]MEE2526480.1 NAD(P)H-dependent oxidoreductase [Hyphobacterium sp. HN65]
MSILDDNTQPRRILILAAHPAPRRSVAGKALRRAAAEVEGVTLADLYAEYPRQDINADREQARLEAHDVIIFLHPFFWYSTPAILKEWQDIVLEHGWAYGHEGNALSGKIFFSALTAGGPETAYTPEGYNHFPVRTLLSPLEQTADLCGMVYLPPLTFFAAGHAGEDNRIDEHAAEWKGYLMALRDHRLDIEAARKLPLLNGQLNSLVKG